MIFFFFLVVFQVDKNDPLPTDVRTSISGFSTRKKNCPQIDGTKFCTSHISSCMKPRHNRRPPPQSSMLWDDEVMSMKYVDRSEIHSSKLPIVLPGITRIKNQRNSWTDPNDDDDAGSDVICGPRWSNCHPLCSSCSNSCWLSSSSAYEHSQPSPDRQVCPPRGLLFYWSFSRSPLPPGCWKEWCNDAILDLFRKLSACFWFFLGPVSQRRRPPHHTLSQSVSGFHFRK